MSANITGAIQQINIAYDIASIELVIENGEVRYKRIDPESGILIALRKALELLKLEQESVSNGNHGLHENEYRQVDGGGCSQGV